MPELAKRQQCSMCNGVGLVKYDMVSCKYCEGIKCMYCNSTGFYKMQWDRCETCYGDGEVDIPTEKKKIITGFYTNNSENIVGLSL